MATEKFALSPDHCRCAALAMVRPGSIAFIRARNLMNVVLDPRIASRIVSQVSGTVLSAICFDLIGQVAFGDLGEPGLGSILTSLEPWARPAELNPYEAVTTDLTPFVSEI